MRTVLKNFAGALLRIFPDCLTQAQAAAFAMFLSFFPLLLFVVGVLETSHRLDTAVAEIVSGLRQVLPPGSRQTVLDFLAGQGQAPWRWVLIGLGGTLLAGTQVMTSLMEGFRIAYRYSYTTRTPFWRNQFRALGLLCVTIGPWLLAVVLTVFGKQLRGWMIFRFGLPRLFNLLWLVVYAALALVVAMLILAVIYRVGPGGRRSWNEVLPGAVVATLLWWVVNTAFGFYVRRMPYSVVYGGLAAAIGLLIWMNLSALVVLLGAAYNAEASAEPAPLADRDDS